MVKNPPALGQEDSLEEGKATHSNIFAWEIPQTEEPGKRQSMGSKKCQTHLNPGHQLLCCSAFPCAKNRLDQGSALFRSHVPEVVCRVRENMKWKLMTWKRALKFVWTLTSTPWSEMAYPVSFFKAGCNSNPISCLRQSQHPASSPNIYWPRKADTGRLRETAIFTVKGFPCCSVFVLQMKINFAHLQNCLLQKGNDWKILTDLCNWCWGQTINKRDKN